MGSGGECADRVWDVEGGRKFYHLRDGRHRCCLGLTFLEAYNGVFKGKKRELVVQSDGKEFVLPLTKSSGVFGGRLNFISVRELSEKCYMFVATLPLVPR